MSNVIKFPTPHRPIGSLVVVDFGDGTTVDGVITMRKPQGVYNVYAESIGMTLMFITESDLL